MTVYEILPLYIISGLPLQNKTRLSCADTLEFSGKPITLKFTPKLAFSEQL